MTINSFDIDPPDVDPDGICENQTTAGAANLVLNGALCDLGTAGQFDIGDSYSSGIAGVKIAIDSAGDINTVIFTVTGLNQYGTAITETITGVTTTAVESTNYYSQITQIAASAAVGSNVFAGPVDDFVSQVVPVNWQSLEPYTTAAMNVTGTINYDMQSSFDQIKDQSPLYWYSYQASKTATLAADAVRHSVTVRLLVNSYSSGAELQYQVVGQ